MHVSKHVVILSEFEECMRPSELMFDRLQVWGRVVNLPFNLRNDSCGSAIAKQIDQQATQVQFNDAGGFLRTRVMLNVSKPLRTLILIESDGHKSTDVYDIHVGERSISKKILRSRKIYLGEA